MFCSFWIEVFADLKGAISVDGLIGSRISAKSFLLVYILEGLPVGVVIRVCGVFCCAVVCFLLFVFCCCGVLLHFAGVLQMSCTVSVLHDVCCIAVPVV